MRPFYYRMFWNEGKDVKFPYLNSAARSSWCPRTIRLDDRDYHTYIQAFSSGAVTSCFYDLRLSRLGFEHQPSACGVNALTLCATAAVWMMKKGLLLKNFKAHFPIIIFPIIKMCFWEYLYLKRFGPMCFPHVAGRVTSLQICRLLLSP